MFFGNAKVRKSNTEGILIMLKGFHGNLMREADEYDLMLALLQAELMAFIFVRYS